MRSTGAKAGRVRRSTSVLLILALVIAYMPWGATPAFAASTYTGGVDQSPPTVMLNDHTPYAIHFSGVGLPANTLLYVSANLSDTGAAGGFTNAPGFTWKSTVGAPGRWVQSREAASSNGAVQSNVDGAVSGWLFFKCGNENFTGFPAGNGHLDNQAYLTVQLFDAAGN